MKILCANPHAQFESYQTEIEEAVLKVMRGNQYILGPEVEALEAEFAEYIGVRHAIGVANGTDAIELALRALEIGQGDEVITVSHTAVATVAAIEAAGATPVLVDIEPDFYTLDPGSNWKEHSVPKQKQSSRCICTGKQQIYGYSKISYPNELHLSRMFQAHGARWQGKRLGSFGIMGCFSCYPTKNLVTW